MITLYSALPLPVIVGLIYRIGECGDWLVFRLYIDLSPALCPAILYAAGQVVLALRRAQTGYDELDEKRGKGMTVVISYSRL